MARTLSAGNNLSNAAAARTAVSLTMACWFKPVDATTNGVLVDIDNNVANQSGFRLSKTSAGAITATSNDTTTASTATTTTTYSAGTWQHACAVFASITDRRAFLNGAGKGTNATSRTPTGLNSTRLGLRAANVEYAGDLAEAAIWSVALSDAEVALLATGIGPYAIQRASIVAYWPLLGTASPESDVVGSFAMTLTGTPPQVAHPYQFYGKDRFQRRGLAA